jgi:hypothetical protein
MEKDIFAEAIGAFEEDYSIVEDQVMAFARAAPAHDVWGTVATQCTRFLEDDQWTAEERAFLADKKRPCETFNRIKPLFNLLTGYQSENRYQARFTPADDGHGTELVAQALTALSLQMDEDNQLPWLESTVFADGLRTGRGYFDIRMDYNDNMMGDGRITTRDPFSILIDPEAETYDPNDRSNPWLEYTETMWMSPVDILLQYGRDVATDIVTQEGMVSGYPVGDAWTMQDITSPGRYFGLDDSTIGRFDFNINMYGSPMNHVNMNRKLVRVLDRQHRQLKRMRWFVDLETGTTRLIPSEWDHNKISRLMEYFRGIQMPDGTVGMPIDVKSGYKRMVRWTVTAGSRVLFDNWSPYEDKMTLVPYFAYFRRGKTQGFIEPLISPQREINIRRSNILHAVMTMANAGWMWEIDSLDKTTEAVMEQHGGMTGLNIKYRAGKQPPQKIQANDLPQALRYLVEKPEGDIKEISGVNDSALGNLDRAQSGVAVKARQKQTLVGNNGLFDNLSRTRELLARMKHQCIQRFYTDPRIVKCIAGDGTEQIITVNAKTAAGAIVNNMAGGNYKIAIDEQPISASFIEGQQAELLELLEKGMPLGPTDWDLVLENTTIANKEKFIKRFVEQRALINNQQLVHDLVARSQIGLPPGSPVPPVTAPEVLADAQAAQPLLPPALNQ